MQTSREPYPFHGWAKVSRADALASRALAGSLPDLKARDLTLRASTVFGCPVSCRWDPPRVLTDPNKRAFFDPTVAVAVGGSQRWALEVEPALAFGIVERMLGEPAPAVIAGPAAQLRSVERGVVAYAAAKILEGETDQHVVSVLTSANVLSDFLGAGPVVVLAGWLSLGDRGGPVRLWCLATDRVYELAYPRWIEQLDVNMVCTIGHAALTAGQVEALEPGDIVTIDSPSVALDAGRVQGTACVRPAGSERTTWTCAIVDAIFRVTDRVCCKNLEPRSGRTMTDRTDSLSKLAGDTPIDLSVELARFSMPLDALARLRIGEVIATGQALGEAVSLRIGQRAVARGELVDVEGEIGVRILEVASDQ